MIPSRGNLRRILLGGIQDGLVGLRVSLVRLRGYRVQGGFEMLQVYQYQIEEGERWRFRSSLLSDYEDEGFCF